MHLIALPCEALRYTLGLWCMLKKGTNSSTFLYSCTGKHVLSANDQMTLVVNVDDTCRSPLQQLRKHYILGPSIVELKAGTVSLCRLDLKLALTTIGLVHTNCAQLRTKNWSCFSKITLFAHKFHISSSFVQKNFHLPMLFTFNLHW